MKHIFIKSITIVFLIVLFNNCGQGFKSLHFENTSSLGNSSSPSPTPRPPTPTPTATPTPRPPTPTPTPTPTATPTPRPTTPTPTPTPTPTTTPRPPTPTPRPSASPPPAGLGWFEIPNTKLSSVCPSASQYPQIQGNEGCPAVVDDWAGGAFDSKRNRLLIWGGGHGGYAGNEIYALSLESMTMNRLNNPSSNISNACNTNGTYPDGLPASRHTYNHLAYLPTLDALFAWGGSIWQCGFMWDDTWLYHFSSNSWQKRSSTNGPSGNYGRAVAYDPNSELVYARDDFSLYSFNASSNSWTKRSSTELGMSDNKTAVIDPVRKRYNLFSNGSSTLYWYDISNSTGTTNIQSRSTQNCPFMNDYSSGWEYDSHLDRLVAWSGGNKVYVMDPGTGVCTPLNFPGGPNAVGNGTFGRFRYAPSMNLYVVCNRVQENCYTLKISE